ncbi:MAG: P-loop NTPase [Phycisphaerales bacterium]
MLDKPAILAALQTIPDPSGPGTLIASGALANVAACDGHVSLRIRMATSLAKAELDRTASTIAAALKNAAGGAGVAGLVIDFVNSSGQPIHTARPGHAAGTSTGHQPIPGLAPPTSVGPARRVIAVGAGKGGVGKSTIAVNLAVGLSRLGRAVGLLDADIYGPSLPTLLGLATLEQRVVGGRLQPFYVHGIKAITIGKLVDPDKPLIWRGPMAHGAFKQLAEQTDWGELDDLIVDLPPGTGDVSLTLAQTLRLTGAVIVCTPQRVAQDDAVRAAKMFQQLSVEVLGVVENMSYFVADDLVPPRTYDLFGRGGAATMAKRLNLPFLGEVPISIALRANSDRGNPTDNFIESTPLAAALESVVRAVDAQAAAASVRLGQSRPTLTVR